MNTSRSGRIRKKSSKLRDYQSVGQVEGQETEMNDDDEGSLISVDYEEAEADATIIKKSLYMSEKKTKNRILMDDGSVQVKKKQRKDKGKSRLTAYMLWARSVRYQVENMDFASKSSRLGEMWANVPTSERQLWKRRVNKHNKDMAKQAAKEAAAAAAALREASKPKQDKKTLKAPVPIQFPDPPKAKPPKKRAPRALPLVIRAKRVSESDIDRENVAAHLKLLGDSLTQIGESLQQHEDNGQNSITGTVSVLLDSLLCSVVPLLSLTAHIKGFGPKVAHMKGTFRNTLDNIAYVMPGLPN